MKVKRFNLFDLAILVVIIGMVVGIIFRAEMEQLLFSDEAAVFEITLKIENIENTKAEKLSKGDQLQLVENENIFGDILLVTKSAANITFHQDGEEHTVTSSDHCNVDLKVKIYGYVSDDVFYTKKGTRLMINETMTLENSLILFETKITNLLKTTESELDEQYGIE